MKEPDYRGIAALTIAACGAVGLFVIVPLALLMGHKMGEVGSDVMIALGGVLIGALATYMGMHAKEILSPHKATPTTEKEDDTHAG